MALTTVLIPFGPGPRPHAEACLRSLIVEFPDVDAEMIAVFDGDKPTKREDDLLDGLGAKVIRLSKQEQLGDVLNSGLAQVDTEYVSRMDCDDIWMPGRLHKQLSYLSQHPKCLLVGGQATTIDTTGSEVGHLESGQGRALRSRLLFRNQFIHPSVTFRTESAKDVGFYPPIKRVEDYALWLALAARGEVANLSDTLISYRLHSSQLSAHRPSKAARRLIKARQVQLADSLGWPSFPTLVPTAAWRMAQFMGDVGLPHVWSRFK
jgi:hypothetical protein